MVELTPPHRAELLGYIAEHDGIDLFTAADLYRGLQLGLQHLWVRDWCSTGGHTNGTLDPVVPYCCDTCCRVVPDLVSRSHDDGVACSLCCSGHLWSALQILHPQ